MLGKISASLVLLLGLAFTGSVAVSSVAKASTLTGSYRSLAGSPGQLRVTSFSSFGNLAAGADDGIDFLPASVELNALGLAFDGNYRLLSGSPGQLQVTSFSSFGNLIAGSAFRIDFPPTSVTLIALGLAFDGNYRLLSESPFGGRLQVTSFSSFGNLAAGLDFGIDFLPDSVELNALGLAFDGNYRLLSESPGQLQVTSFSSFGNLIAGSAFAIDIRPAPVTVELNALGLAFEPDPAIIPLPAALPLFLTGLAGLGLMRRRKRQA